MKKWLMISLMFVLMIVLGACSQATTETKEETPKAGAEGETKETAASTEEKVPKVAFVYIGVPSDGGWTKTHDEMADGNYKMRASVHSSDEIGQLAAKFNNMASSVDMHVNELEEQVHKREQFVADFTHEIKTPMTTIIGYADTMRSVELPREDQISSLNYIVSAGKRLEVMARKLFDLIYLNRSDIEMSQITVDSIVRETERIVNPALLSADITLKKKIDPAMIYGNRDLLATAFINFIDNSRKASKQGSVIEFTGEVSEDNYILSVKDFGIGMKPEHVDKICDEFYMVDKSRSRREGSAGLGMSLASLIIKRHNAELKISSEENVGTCISVIFPLKKEEVTNYEK